MGLLYILDNTTFLKKKHESHGWLSITMGITCSEHGPLPPYPRPSSPLFSSRRRVGGRNSPCAPVFVIKDSKLVTLQDKLRALKTSVCAVGCTSMWFEEFPASLIMSGVLTSCWLLCPHPGPPLTHPACLLVPPSSETCQSHFYFTDA